MQGQVAALVLDQQAGEAFGQRFGIAAQRGQRIVAVGRCIGRWRSRRRDAAEFLPVHARRRQLQRREHLVQLRQRTAADQGQRAAEVIAEAADHRQRAVGQLHALRVRGEFQQGAVHIEEQRTAMIQGRGRQATMGVRCSHVLIIGTRSPPHQNRSGESAVHCRRRSAAGAGSMNTHE